MKNSTVIELLVGLKIPDTTAITTLRTINSIGYKVPTLVRFIYYKFTIENHSDSLLQKIIKTDILVNANKHNFALLVDGKMHKFGTREYTDNNSVVVDNIEDDTQGLKDTLVNLGFKGKDALNKIETGILWKFDDTIRESMLKEITEELLYNKHYEKIEYR